MSDTSQSLVWGGNPPYFLKWQNTAQHSHSKKFHEDLIFEYPQKAQLIRKQKRLWIISRRLLPHPLYHFTGDQPTNQLYCTARDNAHNVHVQLVLWISFLFWQHLKALSRLISKVFLKDWDENVKNKFWDDAAMWEEWGGAWTDGHLGQWLPHHHHHHHHSWTKRKEDYVQCIAMIAHLGQNFDNLDTEEVFGFCLRDSVD